MWKIFLFLARHKNVQCFLGISGSATIKHRCVTHLYGSNAIHQVETFMRKFVQRVV